MDDSYILDEPPLVRVRVSALHRDTNVNKVVSPVQSLDHYPSLLASDVLELNSFSDSAPFEIRFGTPHIFD